MGLNHVGNQRIASQFSFVTRDRRTTFLMPDEAFEIQKFEKLEDFFESFLVVEYICHFLCFCLIPF